MALISRIIYKLKKKEEGASAIEFALILPILIVLVIGIIEFGWILTGYITITGAAREGVRVAVVGGDYTQAVYNHTNSMQALNVNPPSLTPGEPGEKSTVIVTGSLPTLIGFFDFLGESYNFTSEATMRQVGYHAAGSPSQDGSVIPELTPFSNSGSGSSLTLTFNTDIEDISGFGSNATLIYRGNDVDISFNPALDSNTNFDINVTSAGGETSSYRVFYNKNQDWKSQ